jgi:hypothetical protein
VLVVAARDAAAIGDSRVASTNNIKPMDSVIVVQATVMPYTG